MWLYNCFQDHHHRIVTLRWRNLRPGTLQSHSIWFKIRSLQYSWDLRWLTFVYVQTLSWFWWYIVRFLTWWMLWKFHNFSLSTLFGFFDREFVLPVFIRVHGYTWRLLLVGRFVVSKYPGFFPKRKVISYHLVCNIRVTRSLLHMIVGFIVSTVSPATRKDVKNVNFSIN